MGNKLTSILRQQINNYIARSSEYDEWFLRRGRYDRGPELNRKWFAEIETKIEETSNYFIYDSGTVISNQGNE
jgi:hypothetical protein